MLKGTAPAVFDLLDALELHPTNKRGGVYAPIGGFRYVSNTVGESEGVVLEHKTRVTKMTNDGVYVIKSTGNDFDKSHIYSC